MSDDDYLDIRGNVLKIPSGVLEEEKFYEVRVTILNNQKEAMASVSIEMRAVKGCSKKINEYFLFGGLLG